MLRVPLELPLYLGQLGLPVVWLPAQDVLGKVGEVDDILHVSDDHVLAQETYVANVPANDVLAQEEVVNEVLDVPCRQVAPKPGLL